MKINKIVEKYKQLHYELIFLEDLAQKKFYELEKYKEKNMIGCIYCEFFHNKNCDDCQSLSKFKPEKTSQK